MTFVSRKMIYDLKNINRNIRINIKQMNVLNEKKKKGTNYLIICYSFLSIKSLNARCQITFKRKSSKRRTI